MRTRREETSRDAPEASDKVGVAAGSRVRSDLINSPACKNTFLKAYKWNYYIQRSVYTITSSLNACHFYNFCFF